MKAPASKGDRRLLETGFYWRIYGICLTSSGLSPDTESWVHVGRLDTGGSIDDSLYWRASYNNTTTPLPLCEVVIERYMPMASVQTDFIGSILDLHPGTLQLVP